MRNYLPISAVTSGIFKIFFIVSPPSAKKFIFLPIPTYLYFIFLRTRPEPQFGIKIVSDSRIKYSAGKSLGKNQTKGGGRHVKINGFVGTICKK